MNLKYYSHKFEKENKRINLKNNIYTLCSGITSLLAAGFAIYSKNEFPDLIPTSIFIGISGLCMANMIYGIKTSKKIKKEQKKNIQELRNIESKLKKIKEKQIAHNSLTKQILENINHYRNLEKNFKYN